MAHAVLQGGHLPAVVLAVGLLLVVPLVAPAATILAMTFAMGALNASMSRAGGVSVSVTYVTGTLAKLGIGVGRLVCGRAKNWAWLEQGVPWLGLVSGGLVAAIALGLIGRTALEGLPVAALVLAGAAWVAMRRAPT